MEDNRIREFAIKDKQMMLNWLLIDMLLKNNRYEYAINKQKGQ